MKKTILLPLLASCGGPAFSLSTVEQPDSAQRTEYVIPEEAQAPEAQVATYDVRDVSDAGGWDGNSGSDTRLDTINETGNASRDGGGMGPLERQDAESPETSQGCPPPVAPDGFSNVCATYPMRGMTYISTFPGECACDWTCACLMKSSICPGGHPQSCAWVNGSVCNSIVLAAVVCQ